MIGLGKSTRIFVSTRPTDMRKSFDALAARVLEEFGADPLSGAVHLFVARNTKRAKVVWWDGTGFCLFQKKLAKGHFAAPWEHVAEECVTLSSSQLAIFFEGSPLVFMGHLGLDEVEAQTLTTKISMLR